MSTSDPRASLVPATRPTMYFLGVTGTKSSINRVFPAWATMLGIGEARLIPIDLPLGTTIDVYREVVAFIRDDPLSVGALVTTHKIDMHQACADLFVARDRWAVALGEVSCIAKRRDGLHAFALDVDTSGAALDGLLGHDPWGHAEEALLLGAGGSATAILCYLGSPHTGDDRPTKVIVTARRASRLERIRAVHETLGLAVTLETHLADDPTANDRALGTLTEGSLVVNATGLGKDAPGSPLSDAAPFPRRAIAWDLNYRGDLVFLEQARRQGSQRDLRIHDGWTYFVRGWTRHVATVFDLASEPIAALSEELERVAEAVR